ncbi:MAG: hypothetical protein WDO71_21160 [Bacteroidota bacterium]
MQHDNKDIDNRLQNLENQSLPDLSKMDEHWQQMKTMLQPGSDSIPVDKVSYKKYMRWIIAAILISGLFLVTYKLINQNKPAGNTDSKLVQKPLIDTKPLADHYSFS